jgi:hypothetical protein
MGLAILPLRPSRPQLWVPAGYHVQESSGANRYLVIVILGNNGCTKSGRQGIYGNYSDEGQDMGEGSEFEGSAEQG